MKKRPATVDVGPIAKRSGSSTAAGNQSASSSPSLASMPSMASSQQNPNNSHYQFKYTNKLTHSNADGARQQHAQDIKDGRDQTGETIVNLATICNALGTSAVSKEIDKLIGEFTERLKKGESAYVGEHFCRQEGDDNDPLKLHSLDSTELTLGQTHIYCNQYNILYALTPISGATHAAALAASPTDSNRAFIEREMGVLLSGNQRAYIRIPALARAVATLVDHYGGKQNRISPEDAHDLQQRCVVSSTQWLAIHFHHLESSAYLPRVEPVNAQQFAILKKLFGKGKTYTDAELALLPPLELKKLFRKTQAKSTPGVSPYRANREVVAKPGYVVVSQIPHAADPIHIDVEHLCVDPQMVVSAATHGMDKETFREGLEVVSTLCSKVDDGDVDYDVDLIADFTAPPQGSSHVLSFAESYLDAQGASSTVEIAHSSNSMDSTAVVVGQQESSSSTHATSDTDSTVTTSIAATAFSTFLSLIGDTAQKYGESELTAVLNRMAMFGVRIGGGPTSWHRTVLLSAWGAVAPLCGYMLPYAWWIMMVVSLVLLTAWACINRTHRRLRQLLLFIAVASIVRLVYPAGKLGCEHMLTVMSTQSLSTVISRPTEKPFANSTRVYIGHRSIAVLNVDNLTLPFEAARATSLRGKRRNANDTAMLAAISLKVSCSFTVDSANCLTFAFRSMPISTKQPPSCL